ncbi:unnamed protein product, partial [Ectocarpus sp. 4 AP-2014]
HRLRYFAHRLQTYHTPLFQRAPSSTATVHPYQILAIRRSGRQSTDPSHSVHDFPFMTNLQPTCSSHQTTAVTPISFLMHHPDLYMISSSGGNWSRQSWSPHGSTPQRMTS